MTTPSDIHYKRSRFSTRLPWDRLYTASHFWVFEAEPGRWRVGLTKFAARMLGDVVDLEFEVPEGGPIAVGDVIGSLEGFKARTELYAVLQGRFLGGNPALALPVPSSQRLPASLQLVGPHSSEDALLALGRVVETAVS